MIACLECGKEFVDDSHLHKHLRTHKISMQDYYYKHTPRYDKFTGDFIKFINKKQYLNADFNSRENFKKWLTSRPLEEAQDYCRNFLLKRKEQKNLVYAPSQVELRSLEGPSMIFMQRVFKDYYKVCAEIGLKNKYELISEIPYNNNSYTVQIDTREQKPFPFKNAQIKKLDYGDYKISDKNSDFFVVFERKTLSDLVGTLSSGFERFKREIERSFVDNQNLIIIVESSLKDALNFNKLEKKSFTVKTTPAFIFHNVRAIVQEFPSISFLFVDGRDIAMKVMVRIFQMGETYKKVDHQFLYDTGKLN